MKYVDPPQARRVMVKTFRDLRVYQQARALAKELFEISKRWPKEERYSLVSQIRRSSRSVAANTSEAWWKRRYPNHFVSKLTDAGAEVAETRTWLDSALDCGYLDLEDYRRLDEPYDRIEGGLVKMMADPDSWCGPAGLVKEPDVSYDADVFE